MITSLLIDDEAPARLHLRRLLAAHTDVQIVGDAANGLEALERIAELQPHVIFLDIEMPALNGFEVIRELRIPPVTVFTTAFDQYAVRAFDANALDYLLKPVQPDRLAQTLGRVRSTLSGRREANADGLRKAAMTLMAPAVTKLTGRRGNRLILLSPRDVLFVAVEDQLAFLHTATDRFLTERTLAELEQLLDPSGFIRISRSALVNLQHARELMPWTSGTWRIKMSNQAELEVSRERGRALKQRLR
jgi:DNA-binding LytR/AlgR family response regulator